MMDKVVAIVVV